MNTNDYIIRLERTEDYREVEASGTDFLNETKAPWQKSIGYSH